jgi:hypothetical protein
VILASAGVPIATITSTDSGEFEGVTLITTTVAHGFTSGIVTVAGSDVGGYNTTHTILEVPSATTVVVSTLYISDGTGGTLS